MMKDRGRPECWTETKFILAAQKGGGTCTLNPLPSGICTSEISEDSDNLSHRQVIKDMNIHILLQKMTPSQLEAIINNKLCPYHPAL